MLVSHSPPVFSHSPPTGGFLTEYAALRLGTDAFPRVSSHNTYRPLQSSWNISTKHFKISPNRPKPCLVIRPPEDSIQVIENPLNLTKLKKKVVFADDKGMSLTQVRVMTEPSNIPPLWTYRFLAEITQGLNAQPDGIEDPWEITFPQPASDYVVFRKRLDYEKVSLENVIVEKTGKLIRGTIKVRNEAYEKEVFVRASFDDWESYQDYFCTFVSNNSHVGANYVLYDTFSFSIPLPCKSDKIECCVCFKYGGKEYWDNNHKKNYVIVKKFNSGSKPLTSEISFKAKDINHIIPISGKFPVPVEAQAKIYSCSNITNWTQLEHSSPYW